MTVRQLLLKLLDAGIELDQTIFIDDPFGSETWKVEGVVVGTSRVLIQVGERFDSDDEDHIGEDGTVHEAWTKFLGGEPENGVDSP